MTASTLEPGLRIGKYEVVAHIASGGMGAVYKAIDRELGRPVALKVMAARLAENRRGLERFKREARNAAKLSHPNIVTLYDCDYDEANDIHFLAMEFIEGIDLSEHIRRKGQLSPEETRRILIQAVKALDHAYRQGVIHRDIKPSNFLLTRLGDKAVVKLTDMGLAVHDEDEQRVTGDGNTVGTLDYMSPEQARDSRSADVRSDIYSLGCTAYHMLAGKPPFPEGGVGERLYKHLNVAPTDVREFNPAVAANFWVIIERMLAKEPSDRYATPAELLSNLKRTSTEASPDSPTLLDINAKRRTAVEPDPPPETKPESDPGPATYLAAPRSAPQRKEKPPESDSSAEAPAPREKRPRARKAPAPTRVLVGIVAGLCLLVIGGPLLLQGVRSFSNRRADEPRKKDSATSDPNGQTGFENNVNVAAPVDPPGNGSNDTGKSVVDPRNIATPILVPNPKDPPSGVKNPLPKGTERPARASIIPFSAVAPPGKLDEIKAVRIKGTRVLYSRPPRKTEFALTWEALTRSKFDEGFAGQTPASALLIGDHGWTTIPNFPRRLAGDPLDFFQNIHYATMLSDLVFLSGSGFVAEKGENVQVDNKDFFTVLVKKAGRPTLKMFFETGTNLLAKIEYQASFLDQATQRYPATTSKFELLFSDYQMFDGIMHWKKQVMQVDGNKYTELQVKNVKTYASADDALFSSPALDADVYQTLVEDKKKMIKRVVYDLGGRSDLSEFCRLVDGLGHKDSALRSSAHGALAAWAELWRMGRRTNMPIKVLVRTDVDSLIKLFRPSEDPELTYFALEGVTALGIVAAKAERPLKTLIKDSRDPNMMAAALLALSKAGSKLDTKFCEGFLDNPNSPIKDAAALAMLRLAPERLPVERLTEFMTRPNAELRIEAAQHLLPKLQTVTPSDAALLGQGLRHPSTDVRITFIEFVGSLKEPGPDLVNQLAGLMQFKEVALPAVRALENLGKAAEPALPKLKDTIGGPDKPLAVAAAIAVCKIGTSDVILKAGAVNTLVEDLVPDSGDLKNSMNRAVKSRSAATLLELGEPGIPPVVNLLNSRNPKMFLQSRDAGPTAARWVGYELLKDFARQAAARQDKKMIQTLKKQAATLQKFWIPQETLLANQAPFAPISVDAKQAYFAAAESARQAYDAISRLPKVN